MRFEHIPAESLPSVWPKVRTGLERILVKSPEPWIPEHVFTELHERRAFLYFAFDGQSYIGFFVAQPIRTAYSTDSVINIWVLYAPDEDGGNFANVLRFREEADAKFTEIAKAMNASRIRFSGRKGWEKAMPTFAPVKVIFERAI